MGAADFENKCKENGVDMQYFELQGSLGILRGTKHISSKESEKAVLIVPGYFSANRIGPNGLFVRLARRICKTGYHVYRVDLSAMGESDGEFENIDFKKHIEDVCRIMEYIYNEVNNKMVIIGHCLGASMALEALKKMPHVVEHVILLAPFFSTSKVLSNLFKGGITTDYFKQHNYIYRNGIYADQSYFTGNNLREGFIKRGKELTENYSVILPAKDQFMSLEDSCCIFREIGKHPCIIDGADHNFSLTFDALFKNIEDILVYRGELT